MKDKYFINLEGFIYYPSINVCPLCGEGYDSSESAHGDGSWMRCPLRCGHGYFKTRRLDPDNPKSDWVSGVYPYEGSYRDILGDKIIYVNLTPHPINLTDGTIFPPSGIVARVDSIYHEVPNLNDSVLLYAVRYGEVKNLPLKRDNTIFIVSSMVLEALRGKRHDIVAPATGHPDTIRDESGRILYVPGLIK